MTRHSAGLGVILPDGSYLCDGCNVRGVFEHRCHGSDGTSRGVPSCGCKQCADDELAWLVWQAANGFLPSGEVPRG